MLSHGDRYRMTLPNMPNDLAIAMLLGPKSIAIVVKRLIHGPFALINSFENNEFIVGRQAFSFPPGDKEGTAARPSLVMPHSDKAAGLNFHAPSDLCSPSLALMNTKDVILETAIVKPI